jgi:hypothetical protein
MGLGSRIRKKPIPDCGSGAKRHRKYVLDNINNFFEKVLKDKGFL